MTRSRTLIITIAGLMLAGSEAKADPQARAFTNSEAVSMSPADLADALLPVGHPPIETAEMSNGFAGPGGPPRPGPDLLGEIKLIGAASRIAGSAFCTRDEFVVRLVEASGAAFKGPLKDIPQRPTSVERRETYFHVSDWSGSGVCAANAVSFQSTGQDRNEQFAMIEAFDIAVRLVKNGKGPLPFSFRCRKNGMAYDLCNHGARALLQSLSVQRISQGYWDPVSRRWYIDIGSLNIKVKLRPRGGQVLDIEMRNSLTIPG